MTNPREIVEIVRTILEISILLLHVILVIISFSVLIQK